MAKPPALVYGQVRIMKRPTLSVSEDTATGRAQDSGDYTHSSREPMAKPTALVHEQVRIVQRNPNLSFSEAIAIAAGGKQDSTHSHSHSSGELMVTQPTPVVPQGPGFLKPEPPQKPASKLILRKNAVATPFKEAAKKRASERRVSFKLEKSP